MEKQRRLTRAQVIARLREHAATYDYVSHATLAKEDKLVVRSIPLHFVGLAAARHAAGVAGPPYRKPARKTGPKSGSKASKSRTAKWSRRRVIDELRRIARAGGSTSWPALLASGYASLVRAAHLHLGGLRQARRIAGIEPPPRRTAKRNSWTKDMILPALRARVRRGDALSATSVPQDLYAAARRYFGSWRAALAAGGIDANAVRGIVKKYTREVIVARLREAARGGSDLRAISLARVLDLKAVNREFGTLEAAIRAAGLVTVLRHRKHGGTKWDRDRVVTVLRERASRGIHTLTPGLHRVAQIYFGGAHEARAAAGVPDPVDIRMEQRRSVRLGRDPRPRAGRRKRQAGFRSREPRRHRE